SDRHSPMQLRTLLDWDIVPRLRNVPGVIEVNTMGGELKQFQVVLDLVKLRAHRMDLDEVVDAVRAANVNVGGGYVEAGKEAFNVRGQGAVATEQDIGEVVLRTDSQGTPVLVRDVSDVRVAAALRH